MDIKNIIFDFGGVVLDIDPQLTVNEFIKYSHSVSNRRKSRTGNSLELNLESIFRYEDLSFETQAITELKKKPDFLFPLLRPAY